MKPGALVGVAVAVVVAATAVHTISQQASQPVPVVQVVQAPADNYPAAKPGKTLSSVVKLVTSPFKAITSLGRGGRGGGWGGSGDNGDSGQ